MGISKGILAFLGVEYKEEHDTSDDISPWAKAAMEWATDKEIN